MPLIDLQTVLHHNVAKQHSCPYCGCSMHMVKEIQKLGIWCRLMMRVPNIKEYYHCPTCHNNYGLVDLGGEKLPE